MTFIQARNYRSGGNSNVSRIVVHDMESAEGVNTAEDVARWFGGSNAPMASAHFCVDSNSVVQCVHESDTAFHAPPNGGSIGIEHAGKARQSRDEWLDNYGRSMLAISAKLIADLARRHNIPLVRLSAADLRAGRRGICGHADVSAAWHQTSHTDPGPNFPWDYFMSLVRGTTDSVKPPVVNPVDPGVLTVSQYNELKTELAAVEKLAVARNTQEFNRYQEQSALSDLVTRLVARVAALEAAEVVVKP